MQYKTGLTIFSAVILTGYWTGCDLNNTETPIETGTISGSVFSGPIDGAEVKVLDLDGKLLAGPVSTNSEGAYSIKVARSNFASDFIIESTGGEFKDEATGNERVSSGKLSAYVKAGSLGSDSTVILTPASTILCILKKGGGNNGVEADSVFKKAFGFVPDITVKPVDAATAQASSPEVARLAGLHAAAFSRLTQNLELKPERQFELLETLARDLEDKNLDGKDSSVSLSLPSGGNLPEDIQNRYERSVLTVLTARKDNLGLTPDKIGMLPFAKVAFNGDYRVEYEAGMMPAQQGRTQFRIKVSERATGNPAKGVAVKLKPMMYMASHEHSTPMGEILDNGDGTYSGEIYYLMASMMDKKSMGYWELEISTGANGKPVYFYPLVMMGMSGDPVRATLRGIKDKTGGMGAGMATPRSYILFNDGISGTASEYKFNLFVTTMQSMLEFPAVHSKTSLTDEMGKAWEVDSITVSASTDGTTWVEAEDLGKGKWVASGLTGLTKDVASTIRVKLSINGEQKTLDGLPLKEDGSNGYATFSLTPRK